MSTASSGRNTRRRCNRIGWALICASACLIALWTLHTGMETTGELRLLSFDLDFYSSHHHLPPSTEYFASLATAKESKELPQLKLQAHVISSRKKNVEQFHQRNRASMNMSVNWFPASNGNDQVVLDEHSYLTGLPVLNATKEYDKRRGYDTPHHTGCFMSHWHLLRLALASWETVGTRPDALFILEDDATCASKTLAELQRILPTLPDDWDLLFIGGKPFSYHTLDPIEEKWKKKGVSDIHSGSQAQFRQWACKGAFGRTETGPFAPDGSRRLSLNQSYWRTRYITNTQSYLVNPRRIQRVLDFIEHPKYRPIDITYAEGGLSGHLKILMTTMSFCAQDDNPSNRKIRNSRPTPWEGFYYHGRGGRGRWDAMFFTECPDKP